MHNFFEELMNFFYYFLKLNDVHDFKTLSDLMVHHNSFQALSKETAFDISIKQDFS